MLKIRPALLIIVSLFLVPALFFAFSSCSEDDDPYGGTLILSSPSEPEGLNPLIYMDTVSNHLGSMIFNGLVGIDERMEATPELAETWEISQDGLAWTFGLRKGVKFHDGVELTAGDAVFTLNAARSPEGGSLAAPLFRLVKEVEILGRYEFRIVLTEPYAPLAYLLSMEILPAHLFEGRDLSDAEFARNPVGTGPFKFSEWRENEIILTANEEYFEGRPYPDSVIMRFFPDKRRAWSELMQGKVDIVADLDHEDFQVIENDSRFGVYDYLDVFYYTVLFNMKDPLFSVKEMREAVDLAIDRADIIENALSGWAVPTTGPFRPGTWPYNEEVPEVKYDPSAAAKILEGLGWKDSNGDLILDRDGSDLTFTLLADKGDLLKESVAQRVKWQLFQVGIKVEVEFLEPGELFGERLMPGNFQSVLMQFNAAGDPDKFAFLFWHSSQAGRSNLAFYKNPEVDGLIESGRSERDYTERENIYKRIHEIIAEERPAVFLFFRRLFIGASSRFEGIQPDPRVLYRSIKDWKVFEKNKTKRR